MNDDVIRPKPFFWRYIPWLSGSANAIYPHIYLPVDQFTEWKSGNVSHATRATIIHEEVHLRRQQELGIVRFGFFYLCSRNFRFREELTAIVEQMAYLKKYNVQFDIDDRARRLAGWEYGWSVSLKEAQLSLRRLWSRI